MMVAIEESRLTAQMLQSALEVLGDLNHEALQQAEERFCKIAGVISSVKEQYRLGKIMVNEGRLHLNIQKNVARCALYNLEHVGVLLADAAIDAALEAVREEVNREVGFELI